MQTIKFRKSSLQNWSGSNAPDHTDWPPPHTGRPRRRRRFFLIVIVLAVIFFSLLARLLSYYVDVLWFSSLGYRNIFPKTLSLNGKSFTAFAAATFVILYGSFSLSSVPSSRYAEGHTLLLAGSQ